MPNFLKLMNTTYESQSLDLLATEMRDNLVSELSSLYLRIETSNTNSKIVLYRFGSDRNFIEVRVQTVSTPKRQPNNAFSTLFQVSLVQFDWNKPVSFQFSKDSRYWNAIRENPSMIFEILLDEVYNYLTSLLLLKGLRKHIVFQSADKYKESGSDWTHNEIVLIDNFMIEYHEPIRFLIPGRMDCPSSNSPFEFLLALLMKPYMFSEKTFELPHFVFMFYNDKRTAAYTEWEASIAEILLNSKKKH